MFRVENIESPRSGRPVANQFKVVMDTVMTVHCRVHNTTYYIATLEKYSVTTSKYQKIFYLGHGNHLVHQYSVSNFKEWLEALNNQALFNDLLLKEKERQGVSTK